MKSYQRYRGFFILHDIKNPIDYPYRIGDCIFTTVAEAKQSIDDTWLEARQVEDYYKVRMKNKRQLAIEELKSLRKKLHLYTEDNKDLVEKRIKELTNTYKITYGDLWNEKKDKSRCLVCDGDGEVQGEVDYDSNDIPIWNLEKCPDCKGTGKNRGK